MAVINITSHKNTNKMKTTIDNNQRVFLVKGGTRDIFCNLADIPSAIRRSINPSVDCVVCHYWNGKLQRCSKKYLNEMFAANQIEFKIS